MSTQRITPHTILAMPDAVKLIRQQQAEIEQLQIALNIQNALLAMFGEPLQKRNSRRKRNTCR